MDKISQSCSCGSCVRPSNSPTLNAAIHHHSAAVHCWTFWKSETKSSFPSGATAIISERFLELMSRGKTIFRKSFPPECQILSCVAQCNSMCRGGKCFQRLSLSMIGGCKRHFATGGRPSRSQSGMRVLDYGFRGGTISVRPSAPRSWSFGVRLVIGQTTVTKPSNGRPLSEHASSHLTN